MTLYNICWAPVSTDTGLKGNDAATHKERCILLGTGRISRCLLVLRDVSSAQSIVRKTYVNVDPHLSTGRSHCMHAGNLIQPTVDTQ